MQLASARRERAASLFALAAGLGCLLAYSRVFATGFGGALAFAQGSEAVLISQVCSTARIVALAVLTLLAWLVDSGRAFHGAVPQGADALGVPKAATIAVSAALCLSSIALVAGLGGAADVAAAELAGAGTAAAMLAYLAELSRRAPSDIAAASLGSLLIGGLLIAGLMRFEGAADIIFVLAGPGMGIAFLCAGERGGAASGAGGPGRASAGRVDFASFPWVPCILFAASGIAGSMLYGVATALGWNAGGATNYPLFGIASVAAVGVTSMLVWRGSPLLQLCWIPQFSLLLLAMVLAAFSDRSVNPTVLALLLAAVFSYHFLRWMVFPALVSASDMPRVVTCGFILLVTSSFLNVSAGEAIAYALPAGLQLQGGLVAVVAIAFAVAFAAAFLAEHLQRQALMERVPREFEEVLDETLGEAVGTAVAEAEARLREEALAGARADAAEDLLEQRCALLAERHGLTPRESEILGLTARGHSSTYIADQLVISANTVRFHQKNIYQKLDVHDRQSLLEVVNMT